MRVAQKVPSTTCMYIAVQQSKVLVSGFRDFPVILTDTKENQGISDLNRQCRGQGDFKAVLSMIEVFIA